MRCTNYKKDQQCNRICNIYSQSDFHEMAQEMETLYQNHDRSYGKEEAEPPHKPVKKYIVILSILFPMIGILLGILDLSNKQYRSGCTYLSAAIIALFLSCLISFFLSA